MRQSDLPNSYREGLNRPTFWEFARKAGYKTVHIDAWRGIGSGISLAERTLVDSNINANNPVGYLRDQLIADKLLHALKEEGPAFIYVEKYGAHPLYFDKYPPNFQAVPMPLSDAVSSVVSNDMYAGERALAQYSNAIAWSVDEFFRNLLPAIDLQNTLIVYTSDHGQSLLPGRFPHCSTTPTVPLTEANVPLFAITSQSAFEQRLEQGAARSFGQFSHFEIFPTLLLALGYDVDWVKGIYGPSLMDAPSPDRRFLIGNPAFQTRMIPWQVSVSSKSNLRE
jgi:glucan phosphoethanolaminetransferase (alkaline phosphatase superfamily)